MSVFIYESDAFEKIVLVEGEEYREFNKKNKLASFESFLEKWTQKYKPSLDQIIQSQKAKQTLSLSDVGSILGLGGWNRYLVCRDGEILFHSDFSDKEGIDNAKNNGFTVY